jgi:hypothetical protein
MCNIRRAHANFKQEYNVRDSNYNKDFPPAFIDDIFFRAQIDYIDIFYSGNNAKQYKLGFEVTQQRIDMLSNLVVPFSLSPIETTTEYGYNKYKFVMPKDYFHLVRCFATSDCGEAGVVVEQLDDLNIILNDTGRRPSLKWKRLVGIFEGEDSDNKIFYVYSDEPITQLNGSYIKIPNKPFIGGYDSLEFLEGDINAPNINSNPIDIEIAYPYCETILILIAAQLAARENSNFNKVNLLEQQLITKS